MNRRRFVSVVWTLALLLGFIILCVGLTYSADKVAQHPQRPKPSPTPTATVTPTPTPIPTPSPTVTPTPTPDTQAPTANITSPLTGAVLSGSIIVSATASDNVGVSAAYLLVDDIVRGADYEAPYTYSLDTTILGDGPHFMYIRAWDAADNNGDSARVTFTVSNGAPPPTPTPTPTPTPLPSPTPTPTPTPSPTPTPTQLSLFTSNLAHGIGTDGQFNLARQVNILSLVNVVGAQEVSTGDLSNWDSLFAQKGLTRAVFMQNSTIADGQAIWTSLPVLAVYTHSLFTGTNPQCTVPNVGWDCSTDVRKVAVAIVVDFNGQPLLIVNAHQCWSRCANSSSLADIDGGNSVQRNNQSQDLINWVESLGYTRRVLLGDFNMTPYFPQYSLFSAYTDAWRYAVLNSTAVANWADLDNNGVPDMPITLGMSSGATQTRTLDSRIIDFFFVQGVGIVQVEIPDLRQPGTVTLFVGFTEDLGVRPSDHNWMKLTIQ